MKENNHLVWPDYENCLANLPNSILKKWNLPTRGSTLPLADRYLQKDYKNVVILLLDGMGKAIIESHLDKNGPFRSHLAGVYQSVFLSSTVPATTSALSGLQPCEHAWLGWDNYYPQLDKNVTVFLNVIQSTEAPAANYHVASTIAPYENVISRINRAVAMHMPARRFSSHSRIVSRKSVRASRTCARNRKRNISMPIGRNRTVLCTNPDVTLKLPFV